MSSLRFCQVKREGGWGGGTVKVWSGGELTGSFSKREFKVKDGDKLRIQWPNGTRQTITITHKEERGSDGDHGHSYSWNKDVPGFNYDVNGIEIWISLETSGLLTEVHEEFAES